MVEKAEIIVVEDGNRKIRVMFNPSEYETTIAAQFTGKDSAVQYSATDLEDFTVSLFFDSYEAGKDIREDTKKIADLTLPTYSGTSTKRPPICLFSWAGFTYRGLVSKVRQKFTMFLSTGIPVRAELDVTFTSRLTGENEKKYSGNEACDKYTTVKEGDRLDLIAYEELKNVKYWKKIADANNITDPFRFPTQHIGKRLFIPDIASIE